MNPSRLLPAAAAACLSVATLTAAQPAKIPTTDEVIALSPFTVSDTDDKSWQATTTLIGSRTNQELIKVPVNVDVITSEFMRDLGAFSLDDAAAFVAGVTVTPRLESRNDERVTYRGLSTGGASRNFFTWYVPSDAYNVERYDFAKGSNSLMFGDSSPGGQATIYTKRARARNSTEFFASVGAYDVFRFQLDANRKLHEKFFMRVNLANRRNRTYVRGTNDVFRAGHIAFTYEPFKTTTIRIEGERGATHRVRADSALAINDVAAAGRGFSTNNQWYYTSDGEIIQRTTTNPPLAIDRSGPSGSQVSLLQGQTRAVRLPNGTFREFSGFDQYTNMLGSVDYNNRIFNVFNSTIEQRIGKLSLEFAYNQQFQHEDRNDNSFGTSQTPPVLNVDGAGRPYIDEAIGGAAFKIFGNVVKAGRVAAVYPFDFGRWGRQLLVVTALYQKDLKLSRRTGLYNAAAPTGLAASNGIRLRAYLDDPGFGTPKFFDQFLIPNLPVTPTFRPEFYESTTITGPFVDIRYARTQTASLSGDYFKGRVNTLLGVSWNALTRKVPKESAHAVDARGRFIHPGMPEDNPGAYEYDPRFNLSAQSKMAGLTVEAWRGEWARVIAIASQSESFNWQSRQVFFGPDIGPVRGKTREVGLRFELFRKLTYSVSFYDTKRVNAAYAWNPDVLNLASLEDLINPNDVLPGDSRYLEVVNGLNNERRTVNSNEQSRGVEMTLQSQRWLGVQSRVSFSKNRVRAQADFSQFRAYLTAAEQRTTAANAPGGDPTMAELPTVLNNARNVLGSNTLTDEIAGRRSVPYTGSFVLDYQVPRVRGLRVGFNGIFTPNHNVYIREGVPYVAGASFPLHGYLLYDRRILQKYQTTFRLGLSNFYDLMVGDGRYRVTGATSYNATAGRPNYIYRYAEPTTWSFSVTTRM